jgi:ABC-type xylose transport system permease subunit
VAGFLFSIAGLSASFAGLAGLVMAFRHGDDVRPIDTYRLRQMVEFSFANIVLVAAVVPTASLLGSGPDAARLSSALIAVYVVAADVVSARRTRQAGLRWRGWWAISSLFIDITSLILAGVVIASSNFSVFELLLVLLLLRPMLPFLLVLESWATETQQNKAN